MKPYYQDDYVTLYHGDCRDIVPTLDNIQTCITSPPYYGLRDYGVKNQIGLEDTPDKYIAKLADVFQHVYRILNAPGTLWLNLGDSYNCSCKGQGKSLRINNGPSKRQKTKWMHLPICNVKGLNPKNLLGIPWKVAFALQNTGWYLRQDIIWYKNNPMPESVKDRCTKAHEYVFLMSKSARYFFNADAIKEPTVTCDNSIRDRDNTRLNNTPGRSKMNGLKRNDYRYRNKRSVWTISNRPFRDAHFAVFPEKLVEPMILAGSSPGDVVLDVFAGSGTTLLVAKKYGRKAIGIELNEKYCEIAARRLSQEVFNFEESPR